MTVLDAPLTTPVETTTHVKASELLRLTSMLVPQCYHAYATSDGRYCALGTLAYGLGWRATEFHLSGYETHKPVVPVTIASTTVGAKMLQQAYPQLCRTGMTCPADDRCYIPSTHTMGDAIAHLNDFHWWDRPRIADWMEAQGL